MASEEEKKEEMTGAFALGRDALEGGTDFPVTQFPQIPFTLFCFHIIPNSLCTVIWI